MLLWCWPELLLEIIFHSTGWCNRATFKSPVTDATFKSHSLLSSSVVWTRIRQYVTTKQKGKPKNCKTGNQHWESQHTRRAAASMLQIWEKLTSTKEIKRSINYSYHILAKLESFQVFMYNAESQFSLLSTSLSGNLGTSLWTAIAVEEKTLETSPSPSLN